jgi:SPP1 family predicted phage head-tail adaptor
LSATERAANAGVQSAISHRVIIRWRDDVTSKNRLVYRGRTLEIVGVTDPDGRRRELWLECREYPTVESETCEGSSTVTFTAE